MPLSKGTPALQGREDVRYNLVFLQVGQEFAHVTVAYHQLLGQRLLARMDVEGIWVAEHAQLQGEEPVHSAAIGEIIEIL
jgi:hypothetical protein